MPDLGNLMTPIMRPHAPAIPQKLRKIIEDDNISELVPWIGAGFSKPMGFPTWQELLIQIVEYLSNKEELSPPPDPIPSDLRDKLEIIKNLLDILKTPKGDHATAASDIKEYLIDQESDHQFYDALRSILVETDKKSSNLSLGHYLLSIFNFKRVITTNYDGLIEHQVIPAAAVVTGKDTQAIHYYNTVAKDEEVVIKLHGDLGRPDTIPFSKDDFRDTYRQTEIIRFLENIFTNHNILFIGTSLTESEGYFSYLEKIMAEMSKAGGIPKQHYALLLKPKDFPIKALTIKYEKIGIKPIWYETADPQHSQIWEFLSNLAAENPKPKRPSKPKGKSIREAYRSTDRKKYLDLQRYYENKASSVTYVTPSLTNAIATHAYIDENIRENMTKSPVLGQLKKSEINMIIKSMKARRDVIVSRIENQDLFVRAMFSKKSITAEFKKEYEACVSSKQGDMLKNLIDRYQKILSLRDNPFLEVRSSSQLDKVPSEGFHINSYALITWPYAKTDCDLILAFASQGSWGAFETQLIEANTELVRERMVNSEKLWWSAESQDESLSFIQSLIDEYSD